MPGTPPPRSSGTGTVAQVKPALFVQGAKASAPAAGAPTAASPPRMNAAARMTLEVSLRIPETLAPRAP